MGAIRLRCKYEQGQKLIPDIYDTTSVADLQSTIESISGVPVELQLIMFGYPPKKLELEEKTRTVSAVGLTSGETLIIESLKKVNRQACSIDPKVSVKQSNSTAVEAGVRRHHVPADNNCLFYSIYFSVHEGKLDKKAAREYRQTISFYILDNQHNYSEAVLGKSPLDYSAWIQSGDSWGGSIEIRIFSDIFKIQIHTVDIMTGRVDKYNEAKFDQKIMLLYTGIHYDPLYWDSAINGLPMQTVFKCDERVAEYGAIEMANKLRIAHEFTDTGSFKIRCGICNKQFKGEKETVEHAEKSGHSNFQEM